VRDALELGYRHIDTARMYGNEREVGQGLRDGGVDRGEVWLTTKVWRDEAPGDRLRASAEASLDDLGVEYVDLLLLHWPNEDVALEDTLGAMSALRDEGLVRQLGVSNFPAGMLSRALEIAPVFCDQVEFHPLLGQDSVLELCASRDLLLGAYSPFAHGDLHGNEVLREIGEAHGKTAGQVALRWIIEHPKTCALPKASSHERRAENLDVFDFSLTGEERARIDALPKNHRTADPPWAPDWSA
jgi:2,5-diketo-D-gluconate reductase B